MSAEPVDHLVRARRRARRAVFSRRQRVGQALLWPSATIGTILWMFNGTDFDPFGFLSFIGMALADNALWPFWRRPKRLEGGKPLTALAALGSMVPGTRVHVRGRIRAQERMSTYLGTIDDAVYSHLELIGVQEISSEPYHAVPAHRVRALSFTLVGDDQAEMEIVMRRAWVAESRRKLVSRDKKLASALEDELVFEASRRQTRLFRPSVIERWLQDGDEVEVIGTIEQTPDARRESLPREMHSRRVLISTPEQQLTVQLLR